MFGVDFRSLVDFESLQLVRLAPMPDFRSFTNFGSQRLYLSLALRKSEISAVSPYARLSKFYKLRKSASTLVIGISTA